VGAELQRKGITYSREINAKRCVQRYGLVQTQGSSRQRGLLSEEEPAMDMDEVVRSLRLASAGRR
jgi:hypothetical protein